MTKGNVKLLEQHGVHREEVRRQHTVCLGAKGLRPGRPAAGYRSETVSTQDPSDRAGRDVNTELLQLVFDADASLTSVLATQKDDELDQLLVHRWPATTSLFPPTPPLVFRRFSVPSQQGLGGDQERPPQVSRTQTAERGQDGPIRRSVPHSCVELALEDMNLVSEHHDLDLLVRFGATRGADKAQKPAEAEVKEGEGQGG